jgi:hypothetical protein
LYQTSSFSYSPYTNFARGKCLTIIGTEGGDLAIEEHMTYSAVEGGTAFTIEYDMKAGRFLKLLLPMVAHSVSKETKKSLGNLKAILESSTQ